ncbi:JHBP [Nesidiocoris tenuis]|uniref:JHBP n=1 Tax=Nesidiocoris tenuis TaxID=355587 RepID=A0ABN7B3U2_9HEMI|nr:JHBP [Nesidiocoris tenuis]
MEGPVQFWLLAAIAMVAVDAASFPKKWKPCKNDQNLSACIKQSIYIAIPDLVKGMPKLGIFPTDPLHFEHLSIAKNAKSSVGVDLEFHDFDIIGLKNINLDQLQMDWKTLKVNASVPKVIAKGKYKADGKVLVLPVKGEGNCVLELDQFTTSATIYFTEKTVKGKKYYQIEKMSVPIDCQNLKMKFEGLFKGDKAIGDQMNAFMNENWRAIFNEIGPAVSNALEQAFIVMGNRLFSKIPKDTITPP